jgi:hypothetical protein
VAVSQWNPHHSSLSDLYILPLSLKDDLKTNEVGMIALEMAVSNGLLLGPKDGPKDGPWILAPNWEQITVYVVGDFVSVRNIRGFIDISFQHRKEPLLISNNFRLRHSAKFSVGLLRLPVTGMSG